MIIQTSDTHSGNNSDGASNQNGGRNSNGDDGMIAMQEAPTVEPMSPLAAAATATNLLLATGPFTYPEGFSNLGPVTSGLMLAVCCFLAYISATFMIEAISVAVAKKKIDRST